MKLLDHLVDIVLVACGGWTLAIGAMYATETLPVTKTGLLISTFTSGVLFLWLGLKGLSHEK